ncbi:Mth938-like domain-containing protein [soil metagenome]
MRQPPSIDAYGGGGFRVSGVRHEGSLLILDDQPLLWSGVALEALTSADLAEVLAKGPREIEFVLLGTGNVQSIPPRDFRNSLKNANIGLEFMDTPSAARVYNVLASEGRRFAAALIAI